jgi:hypothetical protein
MDHLLPVSVYPINELWNLIPADPKYNSHVKRGKLPSHEKLHRAKPHLELAYAHYEVSKSLSKALHEDVVIRFTVIQHNSFSQGVAEAVVNLIERVAESRNLARF